MKRGLFFLIIFYIIILNANEFDNYNVFYNDIDALLNDFSDILYEEEIDSLINLFKTKGVNYKSIYEITNNFFISDIIYKQFEKKRIIYFNSTIYGNKINVIDNKLINKLILNYKYHSLSFLQEKDNEELNILDNYKIAYNYKNFYFGNFRLKTGKGLLNDYSSLYSFYSIPFFANNLQMDMSLIEYPAYRGIASIFRITNLYTLMFVSFNQYDAILDEFNNVNKILDYNIHSDSLSISRKDNLNEYSGGFILGNKKENINIGFLYMKYSRYINKINKNQNAVLSIYGKLNFFSYEFAYSFNRGYAFNLSLKQKLKFAYLYAGIITKYNFFNTHCSYLLNKQDLTALYARFNFIKPFRIKYYMEYIDYKNDIEHIIEFKPMKYLIFRFNTCYLLNNYYFMIKVLSSYNEFYFNQAMYITEKNSMLIRNDIKYIGNSINIILFAYMYNIKEDDIISQYHYLNENIYPLKNLYEGNGFNIGSNIVLKGNNFNIEFSILYELNKNLNAGISLFFMI